MKKAADETRVKMMNLKDFRAEYGIPQSTVQLWVHTKSFPAYKLGGRWYVDIPAFLKWRELESTSSYKFAR